MSAIKVTKRISWKDVLKVASTDSGIPQKTLDESSNAIVGAIDKTILDSRPDKVGEASLIKTPFGGYKVVYNPERVFQNPKTGEKVVRPPMYGISIGVPEKFVDTANTGIELSSTVEKDKSSASTEKKTAKKSA